jgi:hypothetical protein
MPDQCADAPETMPAASRKVRLLDWPLAVIGLGGLMTMAWIGWLLWFAWRIGAGLIG